jgi:hypothetical protein
MTPENYYELFTLVSNGTKNIPSRKEALELRKTGLENLSKGLTKVAFDTRRIDQDTEFNPRRGLLHYHRSEKFISDALESRIKAFSKLAKLLDQLKLEYGREPEWQDSYIRTLTSSVHKGLRTDQLDGDYSETQPSMASLAYLEELMFVRYRLTPEDLLTMSESNLRQTLLNKDDILLSIGADISSRTPTITKSDVTKLSYEQMMDKMLNTMSQLIESRKEEKIPVITNSDSGKTITITIKG